MSESVSTARLDDSRSTHSVVVSADMVLFAIATYTFDLLSSLRFIFFVVRISKDPTQCYLSLITDTQLLPIFSLCATISTY